jgi:glycosyltransferase involved in cell wall biosynthesis
MDAMKVSLIHGICVRYDAISNAIADQFRWLRGAGHDVRLYAYACDQPGVACHPVGALRDVAFDPHFQQSDLVLFHFGIHYPLFDLLPVAPRSARRVVVFHNITPKHLVAPAQHETIARSFRQMGNIVFADHVLCDSATNLDVLRAARIGTAATVLPLAVASPPSPVPGKPGAADGVVRLAFIGRLVESKGPRDLLAALRQVLTQSPHGPRLAVDIVANLGFSDPVLLDLVRAAELAWPREFGGRVVLRLHGDATEDEKARILREADLFVLPTRHEGFCVPIVEALGAGCRVITYDNSNLPAVTGGHANLLPTGDVGALAQALAAGIAQVGAPAWQAAGGGYGAHARDAWHFVQQFSPATVRRRFLDAIGQLAPPARGVRAA